MSSTSFLEISKGAFITTTVAVLFNPLSIAVGYVLNDYLSAPKLSVEYVKAEPYLKEIEIDGNTLSKVSRNLTLVEILKIGTNPDCQNWIASGQIDRYCLNNAILVIKQLLSGIDFETEIHKSNIESIKAWNENKEELIIQPTAIERYDRVYSIARQDKSNAIEVILGALYQIEAQRKYVAVLLKELELLSKDKKDSRTGEAYISVGVLNSGDSDGAILLNSYLRIGKKEVALALDEEIDPVVKSHSFSKLYYFTDELKTTKEAMDDWRSYIENHTQKRFTIIIKTTAGDLSSDGELPR